jgi:hypothetical protein
LNLNKIYILVSDLYCYYLESYLTYLYYNITIYLIIYSKIINLNIL